MSSNPFIEILTIVCAELDATGVKYAVTGSVASSIHGEPVTTNDIDLCLHIDLESGMKLHNALPQRFYRSDEAMRDAVQRHSMWNLIDSASGVKVDLSVLSREPYYDAVLARRRKVEYERGGAAFWTVSPEDVVLMKLIWHKDSRSAKQWDNALSVVRAQGNKLEWSYLRDWADQLGLGADLNRLAVEGGI